MPEKARRAMTMAQTRFKAVKKSPDLWAAMADFERAAELAPWWPAVYFNMGVAYEFASEKFYADWAKRAIENYRRYLAASPDAKDAEDVRKRSYALETKVR